MKNGEKFLRSNVNECDLINKSNNQKKSHKRSNLKILSDIVKGSVDLSLIDRSDLPKSLTSTEKKKF